ncbi:mechanosensitive ion channel family protein [Alteromonas gilva]|uniref:Mechanosensitive ion channel n=1 Tax=Alteromonas gilva TaxID=2987522 RepID=A0ABT5L5H3_9ALTE|nr:mechanosensitive ion channel domain-containing protein [Alteromonas gilva]MDC8832289.1 mechanosensitive ion channel [Alteromonas gilva]
MVTAETLRERFVALLQNLDASIVLNSTLYNAFALGVVLAIALITLLVSRVLLRSVINKWILKSRTRWDDALHNHGFFNRLIHLLPAITIFLTAQVLLTSDSLMHNMLLKTSLLYLMFTGVLCFSALLNTLEDWYNTTPFAAQASITGFVQVAKLIVVILFLLLSVSLIVDRNPLLLLSGLTAIAAVLLLIFRDTILGFVAGIQITANRLFTNGDWIQVDKFAVDGEIIELGLTNVKVRNWDNTISTIPTYSLTNEAIKNWRGMQESGGRRIKRSVYVDIHSIKLYNDESLKKVAKIRFIADYIAAKVDELQRYHKDNSIDESDLLNRRALSNIGTFRAYLEAYLTKHPKINQDMTLMVRQLPPNELGLPLEVYCFCRDKSWVAYEKVQADIFDHIMAMMPQFELRAYQRDSHLGNFMPANQGQPPSAETLCDETPKAHQADKKK